MIEDILFSSIIAIKQMVKTKPELYECNKKEILSVVTMMENLYTTLQAVPVITDSLAENDAVAFGDKRPVDGESILAIVNDIVVDKTRYLLGYYKYRPNVKCNHCLYGSKDLFFGDCNDSDKWVKSTKTLEELNLEYLAV